MTPGRLRAAAAGAIVLAVVSLVFAFTSGGGDAEAGGGDTAEASTGLTVHWPSVVPAVIFMAVILTVLLVRRRRSKR